MTALPQTAATRPVRVTDLHRMKAERQRIVMTTCYDTLFAKLLDECGVDLLLVGDSVAEVLNGAGSTLAATLNQMIYHATAVCRGVRRALVVCDLPFLSYHVSVPSAIANAGRVMQETGCAAVKLEGGRERAETIRGLVDAGIPVMGHLGLTPQSIHVFGGHRVQGRDQAAARPRACSRAARHENREAARDPRHRYRRWARMRRAGTRVARPARVDRVLPGEVREALRHTERRGAECRSAIRGRGARWIFSGGGT